MEKKENSVLPRGSVCGCSVLQVVTCSVFPSMALEMCWVSRYSVGKPCQEEPCQEELVNHCMFD